MSDQPVTGWDVQRIHAKLAAAEAQMAAAHRDTPRCCCACDACLTSQRLVERIARRCAEESAATLACAAETERHAAETERKVEEVNHRTAEHAALLADYEALHEAHTVLLADHAALHAAYAVAREALSRTRGQSPELH